jgi:hypothetical protein
MKLTKVKDQIKSETRTFYTFHHEGKKLNYTCTTTEFGAVIDEGIYDLNWKEIHDEMLLDKIICSLWPKSDSLEKVLQQN